LWTSLIAIRINSNTPENQFVDLMEKYLLKHIDDLETPEGCEKVRIAVLDTGLRIDEDDNLLYSGQGRVIEPQENFLDRGRDCMDTHGHGTHVARLLLRFAPHAEIFVAKVSEGKSLEETKLEQLVKVSHTAAIHPGIYFANAAQNLQALEWAGEHADIINLSFGLGTVSRPKVRNMIETLVLGGKLIFAAASNSGGNGDRACPACEFGVFAIHATDENGDGVRRMNPPRCPEPNDNFSTLGSKIDSFWNGHDVHISGTSFATPIAAAMAANALEYARCKLTKEHDNPGFFRRFIGMRALFKAMADSIGDYDYVKPWKHGMWDDSTDMCKKLRELSTLPHFGSRSR
jgi:hypothetical protein